jgi:hypothetical protein
VTDQATRVVPAGWYQDPATPEQVRWWNGLAWTEHVREKPSVSQAVTAEGAAASAAARGVTIRTTAEAAEATESTEQRIAAVRDLERQFGIGTSENEIITPAAAAGAAQSGSSAAIVGAASGGPATGGIRAVPRTTTTRTATGSAWLIALSPVLALALGIAAAYVYFYVSPTLIVFVVAVVLPYLLAILWALGDGRALRARGFHPPSPAFALLTGLGYLIVRRIRVPGSGPLAMLIVVGALALGSFPAAALLGQLNGIESALNIQHTISADYVAHGEAVSVSCPAFVDATTTGTLYTCDATTAIGTTRQIWVSIDGDGKFTYALAV